MFNNSIICKRPHVGVAVIIIQDDKILLGKRISAHGKNTWGFPGGKLDLGEDIETCAKREAFEETSLKLKNIKIGPYTNDIFDEKTHYITLFVIAEISSGTPKIMEKDKCSEWKWFEWNNLPTPLFLPILNLLKQGYYPKM